MSKEFLKLKIKLVRNALHLLLRFLKPSNKHVVTCSQFLDNLIVAYQLTCINIQYKKHHRIYLRSKTFRVKKNSHSIMQKLKKVS